MRFHIEFIFLLFKMVYSSYRLHKINETFITRLSERPGEGYLFGKFSTDKEFSIYKFVKQNCPFFQ